MSGDNPLQTTSHHYPLAKSASRGNETNFMSKLQPQQKNLAAHTSQLDNTFSEQNGTQQQKFYNSPTKIQGRQHNPGILVQSKPAIPKYQTMLVERFRQKLKSRGGRGLIGLRRQFKIMDDNGSGALDRNEFKKAIRDYQVDMEEQDLDNMFKAFDLDGSGEINFDEFVRVVVGPMNNFR